MDGYARQLLESVSENFGMAGQMVVAFLAMAVIPGTFLLIQNLPAPEGASLCEYCKFKDPNENAKVYNCPDYKRCRTLQLRAKKCPRAEG
jgi:hypothetical protein